MSDLARWGCVGNELLGIFFTESSGPPNVKRLGKVKYASDRQNSNLGALKLKMAKQAQRMKADAVVDFSYGQKAKHLAWDNVRWYASGVAVKVLDAK